jgi:protein TonB
MAYADQQMGGTKASAFVVVALLHVLLGLGLWAAFNYDKIQQAVKRVTTVDIKKDEPKKEPPKPPEQKAAPPPIVAPPPKINVNLTPPPVETVVTPPPAAPIVPIIAPPAPVAPPPPRFQPKGAVPKGRPGEWVTTNDYPSRALREEREGVTRFRLTVGPDGRVQDCQITGSSGSPDLDEAACANLRRRGRFTPATDGEGQPTTGSYGSSVRWQIPKE